MAKLVPLEFCKIIEVRAVGHTKKVTRHTDMVELFQLLGLITLRAWRLCGNLDRKRGRWVPQRRKGRKGTEPLDGTGDLAYLTSLTSCG